MTRALIALALLVSSVPTSGARAEVIELPSTKARLVLGAGWKAQAGKGLVVAYRGERGATLAVTRADVPNSDAWSKDKKQGYADAVEKGIKARVPGYKRLAKKLGEANGIPALDVEARRDGGATVIVRVLMFHTYALSLAIEVPKGGELATARAIAHAFAPPKESEHHDD